MGAWEDDILGSNTYAYSFDGLASALPNPGRSFLDTRLFEKDGARYSSTLVVSRPV